MKHVRVCLLGWNERPVPVWNNNGILYSFQMATWEEKSGAWKNSKMVKRARLLLCRGWKRNMEGRGWNWKHNTSMKEKVSALKHKRSVTHTTSCRSLFMFLFIFNYVSSAFPRFRFCLSDFYCHPRRKRASTVRKKMREKKGETRDFCLWQKD